MKVKIHPLVVNIRVFNGFKIVITLYGRRNSNTNHI